MIRLIKAGEITREELTKPRGSHADVSETVSDILSTVRREGDAALLRYTEKFDHVRLQSLAVAPEEYEEGLAQVEDEFLAVLRKAAENIRRYHENTMRGKSCFYRHCMIKYSPE